MTLRTRLLLLSLFVGVSIVVVTMLFSVALSSLVKIEDEKSRLTALGDSVLSLSIVVNSLDSAQYGAVSKKLDEAMTRTDGAFDDLGKLTILPTRNDELKKAFEIIGNMRALMADDLKSLKDQYVALAPDLKQYFLEAYSTTLRMFYTNDPVRQKNNLSAVFGRIDNLITTINGLTETLAGVSDTIRDQSQVINDETAKIRDESLYIALGVSGFILLATVALSLLLGTSISRRVKVMQKYLSVVSQGDFSQALEVRGNDEIAAITRTVNSLLDSLNRLLGQVKAQVEALKALGTELSLRMGETALAVETIESNLDDSHGQLQEQTRAMTASVASASSLGEITDNLSGAFRSQLEILSSSSSGIEQIIANIGSVNANTVRAEGSSRILAEVSREGQGRLDSVARAVKEITKSSENLVRVTAVINEIAEKTNLLAMNASIEAAHAGGAGRGFGVVADEIRKLAEQAGSQAKSIAQDLKIVNDSIREIDSATIVAVEVFQKIVAQTAQVGTIVQEVQSSMDEQNRGGVLVLEGLRQLNEMNDKVVRTVDEMKRGEVEILDRIQTLARQNAQVNENNETVLNKTREIGGIIDRTNALADTTKNQIVALEHETSQFRFREVAQASLEELPGDDGQV